jgi:hypothetical protein
MKFEVEHLRTGWADKRFEETINTIIDARHGAGWTYHDIKVSSSAPHCLLIFKKE